MKEITYTFQNTIMKEPFEAWALVELMGHNKIVGRVSEHQFGNQSMLRVDVPEIDGLPAFSKLVAISAVYAINPMTETDAIDYAKQIKAKPFDVWSMEQLFKDRIEELINRGVLARHELPSPEDNDMDFDDEDGPF